MSTPPVYCSDFAAAAGENLAGSATQTLSYLLVEYNEAWGEKTLPDSSLPEAVKARLKALDKANPQHKTLLVRSSLPDRREGVRVFAALVQPGQSMLYAFQMADYTSLLDMDLEAILSGDSGYSAYRRTENMILVCTNGRRDACCARHGVAALTGLVSATLGDAQETIWHSSHIGGHRFAANVLCLPQGLLYGRIGLADVTSLLAAQQRDEVLLSHLRGRTCYPAAVQAAEIFVRQQLGRFRLDDVLLHAVEPVDETAWQVEFDVAGYAQPQRVSVQVQRGPQEVYDSCQLDKLTPVVHYSLALADAP